MQFGIICWYNDGIVVFLRVCVVRVVVDYYNKEFDFFVLEIIVEEFVFVDNIFVFFFMYVNVDVGSI